MAVPVAMSSPRPKARIHPFLRDIGSTAIAGVLVLVSSTVLIALMGRTMGPNPLAQYLLARRIVAWMQSSLIVCSALALPYYVSRQKLENEGVEYFLAALATDGLFVVFAGIVLHSAPRFFSYWLFGDSQLSRLLFPLSVWTLGYAFHGATFGYHRGRLQMLTANVLQLVNIGALVFLTFAMFERSRNIVAMLTWTGILMIGFSIVFAFPRHGIFSAAGRQVVVKAKQLLTYGLPRIPSQFGFIGLTALGPIIASHYLPLGQVTFLLLGGTLFSAFSLSVMPLSIVLLSKVSRMLSENRIDDVARRLEQMQTGVLHMSFFATIMAMVFTDVGLRVWLGKDFVNGAGTVRILLLGMPFYAYISSIASSIDAAHVKAHNSRNVAISLACYLVLAAIAVYGAPRPYLSPAIALAWSLTLVILAGFTAHSARVLLKAKFPLRSAFAGLLAAAALGGVALLFERFSHFHGNTISVLGVIAILSAAYAGILFASGTEWVRECRHMLAHRSG
ncbi:MAG: lipopolysaccharide biosynthesis protein [Terracidiphilus sp.]